MGGIGPLRMFDGSVSSSWGTGGGGGYKCPNRSEMGFNSTDNSHDASYLGLEYGLDLPALLSRAWAVSQDSRN